MDANHFPQVCSMKEMHSFLVILKYYGSEYSYLVCITTATTTVEIRGQLCSSCTDFQEILLKECPAIAVLLCDGHPDLCMGVFFYCISAASSSNECKELFT